MPRKKTRKRDDAAPRVISALDGWPETKMVRGEDGAVRFIRIRANVQTAKGARRVDFLQSLIGFTLMIACLAFAILAGLPFYTWALMPFVPLFFMKRVRRALWRRLKKTTELAFGEDKILIRLPDGETVALGRHEITSFRLRPHDKAKEEAEANELAETRARARGRIERKAKYYQDTFTLEAAVGGSYPWDLMEIFGERDAVHVLARVKQVNELMDQIMAMGEVAGERAAAEWDDMAGAIPEKV